MADDIEVNITGLDALQAKLEELAGPVAKAIVRDGLKQGGDALRGAMQVSTAAAFSGEPARIAADPKSWARSVKMVDDLAGVTRVSPKGVLVDLHVSRGKGRQPLGAIYRRSLRYLIKLCEFGSQGGKDRGALGHKTPMSSGFETYKGALLEKLISVIREKLGTE